MTDEAPWYPRLTAPQDGRLLRVRIHDLAPYHVRWKDGRWQPVEYQSGADRFTHWQEAE